MSEKQAKPARRLYRRRTAAEILDSSITKMKEGKLTPIRLGSRDVHYRAEQVEALAESDDAYPSLPPIPRARLRRWLAMARPHRRRPAIRRLIGKDPITKAEVWRSNYGPIDCRHGQRSIPAGEEHVEVIPYETDGEFKTAGLRVPNPADAGHALKAECAMHRPAKEFTFRVRARTATPLNGVAVARPFG